MVPQGSGPLAKLGRDVSVTKIGLEMPQGERLLSGLEEFFAELENRTAEKGPYGKLIILGYTQSG